MTDRERPVVVPLCRAERRGTRAVVRCPHCSLPDPGADRDAVVLPITSAVARRTDDSSIVAGEL